MKSKSAEEWMETAAQVAKSAMCLKAKCGTVIVKDGVVIGEGYNAPPLDKEEHRMCGKDRNFGEPKYDKTCCMHAEWRAMIDALRRNSEKLAGSKLYFTRVNERGEIKRSGKPLCTVCSRMALDLGIEKFVLWHETGIREYPTDEYNQLSYEYKPFI